MRRKHVAVSLVEMVIALAVVAFIAGLVLPKLLVTKGDNEIKARMREVFTVVGEAYGSRKRDDAFALAPTVTGAGVLDEPLTFYQFLHQNTNFVSAFYPAGLTTGELCDSQHDYIRFHNGSVIRGICPLTINSEDIGLVVTVKVPVNANTTTTFEEVVLFPTDNNAANDGLLNRDLYTTRRGYDLLTGVTTPSACTMADNMLGVDPTCAGTAP